MGKKDVVKVAVEMKDKPTQLIELDQTRPLECIIQVRVRDLYY